ncbi:NAD(P)/FAD-dependent oxidoreductase [Dactylosporangium sp. CA-139114]|uniref:NAD(P)/FAD-dependent oxidoreductase n=1 Tax=Dactylosporangium sp. CA-139114 TaxID=3239931 RepID=UPI003D98C289
MRRIVIVGAGIIGATLAARLAGAGADVTLVDARRPGTATSATSLAWLNANQKLPRHYHDYSVRAMHEWRELMDGFGRPDWYVPTGGLSWAESDSDRRRLAERLDRLRDWGYPAVELTPRQAVELEPALRVPGTALVASFPAEGYVHGRPAVDAFVTRARAAGARVVVTGGDVLVEAGAGGVSAVRLPDGGRLDADVYVSCAGWRTGRLLEPLGVVVPIVPGDAPGSSAPCVVTRVAGPGTHSPVGRLVHPPGLSLRPALGGGLQLEAGDLNDLVDVHTTQEDLDRHGETLLRRAERVIPGLAARPIENVRCFRPLPVDGHPLTGWLPTLPNTYLIVSHSGMTLAPLLARHAATEILDGTDHDELAAYRLTRFATSELGPSPTATSPTPIAGTAGRSRPAPSRSS